MARLATAIRWGTLSLAVLETLPSRAAHRDMELATALVVYALLRTVQPLPSDSLRRVTTASVLEALLNLSVISLSGGWGSPFLLCLGSTLVIGGLEGGASAVVVVTTVLLTGAAGLSLGGTRVLAGSVALERITSLAVVGGVGAYARRVLHSADSERLEEVRRLRSAHEVNRLLLELYARVAGGPVTLSLSGALAGTLDSLRSVLAPDVVALLLAEGARDGWQVVVCDGVQLPVSPGGRDLPAVLGAAAASEVPVLRSVLAPGEGLAPTSTSGIYASLRAGTRLVGILAVERGRLRPRFSDTDAALADEVARHGGLAIDNARWFSRLHTLGAATERGRIARELHDRVGQSLAATGLAMDLLASRADADPATPRHLRAQIRQMAAEIHSITRGVREELTDLRHETGPGRDLEGTLAELLGRVRARSGLGTELVYDAEDRPTPVVEHEIWRIAQEAVLNAERHASATRISVTWRRGDGRSVLEVADDGRGIDPSLPARADAYGLVGMRERAEAIGAQLVVASPPGRGTTVRLSLGEG